MKPRAPANLGFTTHIRNPKEGSIYYIIEKHGFPRHNRSKNYQITNIPHALERCHNHNIKFLSLSLFQNSKI